MNKSMSWAALGCLSFASLYSAFASADDAAATSPQTPGQTVVVSASPITEDDKLATIVENVSREQILRSGGANLADALNDTPGVTGTSFASGASRPVIRGFDANRVRVLEDGVGSFDVSDIGPDHGVPIDPLSAQSIEVVRGAATLRYGSQAIGGVVNAINNRVPTQLPDKPFSGEANALYGTNADTRQGSALLDGRVGQFAIHADGFDRHTDNYDIPQGTQDNSFFRGDGYSLGSSYFFGPNRVGAAVVHYDAKYGIPSDTTYIDMKQTKELLRSSFAPGLGAFKTLNVDGGYADYEHSEKNPDGSTNSTFKDREWDTRAEGLFEAMGPFSASALGLQVQQRDFSALGADRGYLFPTVTKTVAGFAFANAPLGERLQLQTGARVESVRIDGIPASDVPTSRNFTPISASAGLLYEASDALRLGLTLSSAARAPAQTEMFARGAHDGPGTFETGDPTLDMERANSLEGTMRVSAGKSHFEGALWGAKFNNYIFGNVTGRTCDEEGVCAANDSGEFKELLYQQSGAKFWGAEARSTFDLFAPSKGGLQVIALVDYVRAKLDDGSNVPRITPYHVGGGLTWDGPNFDAGFLLKYSGRQNNVAAAETPTAGFVSLDAQTTWRPFTNNPGIEVALIGHNLTDSVQRNAVAINKDVVELPGREVRLMVRATL